jgi:putative PIN family toxin of toxin-antitoxin system
MKRVVIDTNVLLVSISEKSKLHWIFKSLTEKAFELCVSTDNLAEYAEIIQLHMGAETSNNVLSTLENLSNVVRVDYYYRFQLLDDPDDNKFVDCCVAANADYIVTHDFDFNKLSGIAFPVIKVIDSDVFRIQLSNGL